MRNQNTRVLVVELGLELEVTMVTWEATPKGVEAANHPLEQLNLDTMFPSVVMVGTFTLVVVVGGTFDLVVKGTFVLAFPFAFETSIS